MATDGPTPAPCSSKFLKKGKCVCVLDGSSNAVERWVRSVAEKAEAQVDWYYLGGRAVVLHLGNEESRQRVMYTIEKLKGELNGHFL